MTTRGLARLTSPSLRVSQWQGDTEVAMVAPLRAGSLVAPSDVDACLEELRKRGYRTAFTSALGFGEQQVFLAAGFHLEERLHLLEHNLRTLPEAPATPWDPRRHHRGELQEVLAVDQVAFSEFWRFDERSLREARHATPVSRLRVIGEPGCVGYAVFGRAQNRGYLQRLAVHPDMTGQGLGASLVLDGLQWLCRHGANQAMVNTQESNTRAYHLYCRLGFQPQPLGLAVLRRDLSDEAWPV